MPLNIDSFRTIANQTVFGSRDIAVQGQGETAAARLGNFVFSQGAKTNDATMAAFKAALEKEYGVFGRHAFDSVLGLRAQMHKSLRAMDVKATLSALETVKRNRFIGELSRQLDTNPKFRELSDGMRKLVRSTLSDSPIDGSLKDCATDADLAKKVVTRIDRAIDAAKDFIERKKSVDPNYDVDQETHALEDRQETEHAAKDNEPTGLRRLKTAFGKHETSVEDQVKKGLLGAGMRVNRSSTNPVILDKLKTNGVEPGFIYRNDWSTDDTRGFMADVNSAESRAALDALKAKDPAFAAACEGKTVREQVLFAGRAHPAAMAAASELLIEEAAKLVRGEGRASARLDAQERVPPAPDAVKALAKALKSYFSNPNDIAKLSQISGGTCDKALLDETKKNLFVDIRDAVMSMGPKNADGTDNVLYARSPASPRRNFRSCAASIPTAIRRSCCRPSSPRATRTWRTECSRMDAPSRRRTRTAPRGPPQNLSASTRRSSSSPPIATESESADRTRASSTASSSPSTPATPWRAMASISTSPTTSPSRTPTARAASRASTTSPSSTMIRASPSSPA